jgi:hypothetical protein
MKRSVIPSATRSACGRIRFRYLLGVLLALFVVTAAGASTVVLDQAAYDGTSGTLPDSAVWAAEGAIAPIPIGTGLVISDPGNSSSLLYSHATGEISLGDTATIRVTVRIPPVDGQSTAWSGDTLGWRLFLDDGFHRLELAVGRDPTSLRRQLIISQTAGGKIPLCGGDPLAPICNPSCSGPPTACTSFAWDNDLFNTYEIKRLADGNFQVVLISADPASPTYSPFIVGACCILPASSGAGFGWGSAAQGGGAAVWQSVHAEVDGTADYNVQFLQPLDQSTDASNPVLNTAKNGRVIPVKVQLGQGGTELTDQNTPGPVTIGVSRLSSCAGGSSDQVETYADAGSSSAGTSEFRYDPALPGWIYNLDTKALGLVTDACYRIDVAVDGTKAGNAFAVLKSTK